MNYIKKWNLIKNKEEILYKRRRLKAKVKDYLIGIAFFTGLGLFLVVFSFLLFNQ